VNTILRRQAYTGTTYYNRTCKDPNRTIGQPKERGRGPRTANCRVEQDRERWIPVAVPQIISSTLWEQVQVQLELNRKFAPRNNKRHFYLLRALLVCGECGRTLAGRSYANGTVRYYCTNQGSNRSLAEPCPCPPVDGNVVEPLVWQAVAELLADPQLILDYYLARQDESDATPHELKRLRQELSRIENQRQRLLDAYQTEAIELDELETRSQVLDQQRQVLEQRLSELEQLAQQQARQDALTSGVAEFCENIKSVLQSPTPEEQQQMLRLVVDHILVGKEQLTIKHVIPLAGDRRLYIRRSQVRTWLHKVAQATWHEEKKRWKLRRTVGREFNLFGIHWEAGWSESDTSITGHSYVQGAYYRITLVTDDDFSPIQFVVECRHENRRKNRHIKVEVSIEDLKAALMEAAEAGPAQRYYVFEDR